MAADPIGASARRAGPRWAPFCVWAMIGAGYALGLLSILTVGAAVLALTAIATLALARWRAGRVGVVGLVAGVAVPLFYVAYLNRDGPGTTCTPDAQGTSCTDEWSPWPFIAVGLVVLIAGCLVFTMQTRRQARP